MLRKSLILVGVVAAALVWSAAAQAVPGVATGNVHMRTGPGASYPVVVTIPKGAPIDIGRCTSWCEVAYAGRQGYAFGRYVTPTRPEAAVRVPGPTVYYYYYGRYYDDEPFFYGGYPFTREPFIRDFSFDRPWYLPRNYHHHHH